MKYKILAIVGPSGCGKDSLLKLLSKKKVVNTIITSTTRPIRSNEIKDRDYHFLTKEQFAEKVLDLEMIEATVFNDWCYGTDKSTLSEDKINIGVFNPYSIDILADNSQIDLKIIYLRCSDKERLLRQLNREQDPDIDEIIRRFKSDKIDFEQFELEHSFYEVKNDTKDDLSKAEFFASRLIMLWDKID